MNIYVKASELCNFRCKHCFNPESSIPMNFEKTWKFLSFFDKEGNWFILHGGEPLLGDENGIRKLLKRTKHASWRVSTNLGYDLTPTKAAILFNMRQVRTSFDIGIRFGTMKNLLVWLRNVQKLTKVMNVYVNVCLTKQLLKHSPEQLMHMLDRMGVKSYGLERITVTGRAKKHQEIIPHYEDVDEWLCKLYDSEMSGKYTCKCDEIKRIELSIEGHSEQCYGKECCMQTLTINANGTIGNCPNDAREDIIGDIDMNPDDIMTKLWKKRHIPPKECLACKLFEFCHGFCEQMSWQNNICPYPKKLAKKIMETKKR